MDPTRSNSSLDITSVNKEIELVEYVGYAAILVSILSLLPQIYHIYTTKNTKGLSYAWLFIAILGSILCVTYAFRKNMRLVLLSSTVYIILYSIIVWLKYIYEKKNKYFN